MKNIKLQPGFLVQGWTGKIEEVTFAQLNVQEYGAVEAKFIVVNKEGVMYDPISRYSDDKVFDNKKDAENHSVKLKNKQILYYETQAKEYLEKVEELKKT